ncbi:MAG: hypothetical protein U0074_01080 [Kouleothrix sp.]
MISTAQSRHGPLVPLTLELAPEFAPGRLPSRQRRAGLHITKGETRLY